MDIVKFPDPVLFEACHKVVPEEFGDHLTGLLESMYELMKLNRGVGLSANQVGLSHRMFVMEGPNDQKLFLINPFITARSALNYRFKEGCLSAPGEFVFVEDRSSWVQVTYQDEKGNVECRVFRDIHSVCVQHEIDHLDGKSFLESKSIPRSIRKGLAKKWGFKLK